MVSAEMSEEAVLLASHNDDNDTRTRSRRRSQEPFELEVLTIPVLFDVEVADVFDSWGDPRSGGRSHEGVDILAPRGTFIVSPREARVIQIGEGSAGGVYVYTESDNARFYYAHLEAVAPGLDEGDRLRVGDLIGTVGDSGNALGGVTHLHLGIYTNQGAINPYPLLTKAFTNEERLTYLERFIDRYDSPVDQLTAAQIMVRAYPEFFRAVLQEEIELSPLLTRLTTHLHAPAPRLVSSGSQATVATGVRDLELGATGSDVVSLQQRLIALASGPRASELAQAGATGYFGPVTQAALIEYQQVSGVYPALGYYGPLTRAAMGK